VRRIWWREGLKVLPRQKPRGRLWWDEGSRVRLRVPRYFAQEPGLPCGEEKGRREPGVPHGGGVLTEAGSAASAKLWARKRGPAYCYGALGLAEWCDIAGMAAATAAPAPIPKISPTEAPSESEPMCQPPGVVVCPFCPPAVDPTVVWLI